MLRDATLGFALGSFGAPSASEMRRHQRQKENMDVSEADRETRRITKRSW